MVCHRDRSRIMMSSLISLFGFLFMGTGVEALAMSNPVMEVGAGVSEVGEEMGRQVGAMVGQVLEQHLAGCHLVLATTTQHSPIFSHIIR